MTTSLQLHRKYYLSLEEQLLDIDRYVEICEDNFTTYSIAFTQLLLSACSEVDTVCKLVCRRYDPTDKSESISEYKRAFDKTVPEFYGLTMLLVPQRIVLRPWFDWRLPDVKGVPPSPAWWRAHNKVKHQRNMHYKKANLENCLNAVAAIYCLFQLVESVPTKLFMSGGVNKDETYPSIRFFPEPR